jgi:putative phosphoribosyl transferase
MKKIIHVPLGTLAWEGDLYLPPNPKALVVFVHGTRSGRYSFRNNFIAQFLEKIGFASFVFDLTLPKEKHSQFFNVPAFSARLLAITEELKNQASLSKLPVIFFGGSSGAAVAMVAAAKRPRLIHGFIARGGRLDLAAGIASKIPCPVLLLVGDLDEEVLRINQTVLASFPGKKELRIIPGADHLFESPGKLEQVALESSKWLSKLIKSEKKEKLPWKPLRSRV